MKPDERKFLDELQRLTRLGGPVYVRDVVADIGMHPKRAACICEKWAGKRWYDYGVNVLSGWLEPAGLEA